MHIPATQATLWGPNSIAVHPDGSIYIGDQNNQRVRKIGTDGIITTVAGGGGWSANYGDDGPATQAYIGQPTSIAIDKKGSLYIVASPIFRVRKVSPNGIITAFAGDGPYANRDKDGIPALTAYFYPYSVAVTKDGTVLISDYYKVRRVGADGIMRIIAGSGEYKISGDGGLAKKAGMTADALSVGPNGIIYFVDHDNNRIRRLDYPGPGFGFEEFQIVSDDGSEMYLFNAVGRHLRTHDALTGALKYRFDYDQRGNLSSITDGDSLRTVIESDTSGRPFAIIAPFGQRTTFSYDDSSNIAAIANPAGESYHFNYLAENLMGSMTNPRGFTSLFSYDSLGRINRDTDPAGGFKTFNTLTLEDGYESTVRTAENRVRKYRIGRYPNGNYFSTNTDENGLMTQRVIGQDGTTVTSYPDSTLVTSVNAPDPRFGMDSPILKNLTYKTPGGLQATLGQTRTITQMIGARVGGIVDTVNVNGVNYISKYDGVANLLTSTSPEGRKSFTFIDSAGRAIKDSVPGIAPVLYSYDTDGFLSEISQAGRTTLYAYDTKGQLSSVTDPLHRTVQMQYDSAGRVTRQIMPDLREILYSYDSNGNLTSLTPPGKPAHSFDYTSVDLTEKYSPPELPVVGPTPTRYEYNLDKQLTRIIRPDNNTITVEYDTASCGCGGIGKPKTISFDRGQLNFSYKSQTGQLFSITAPGGNSLEYRYDGLLPTRVTMRGDVNATIDVRYDNNLQIVSQKINLTDSIGFSYDQDGMLKSVGTLKLINNPANRLLLGDTLGNVTNGYSYSPTGELSGYAAKYGSTELFQTTYMRDSLGRIIQLDETIQGEARKFNYRYDQDGRLSEVLRNDTLISAYTYDSNGNRRTHMSLTGTDSGAYDKQDRLVQYGNLNYFYTLNGDLSMKVEGVDTTRYTYDSFGNLMTVILPDGKKIEYVIDGQNRRVGRKVDGVFKNRYLYASQLSLVAELDNADSIIARFIYGTHMNIPDYIVQRDTMYRVITDHLGSVRIVINAQTGEITQQIDYDEYGNIFGDTNPGFQPFGYAGGLYDNWTKLIRFGARDYSPGLGRWTTKDPINFSSGDNNLYAYVQGNPLNEIDPSGLSELCFDRSTNTLYITPRGARIPILIFPASNNAVRPNADPYMPEGWGPAPNGNFAMGRFINTGNNSNSSLGIGFIPIYLPPKVPFIPRTRVGLHSGRNNKGGYKHKTHGCIRTTDDAMNYLKSDPPTSITIGECQ